MTEARVVVGGRLHFGFCNLSLAHDRLYGALGVALDAPRTVVRARPAAEPSVAVAADVPDAVAADAREHAARACDLLSIPGAALTVAESLPRHAGLGSGTALALSVLAAVARAHDSAPRIRERAPALGRGGRSGVGVAAFESGGILLDAGHPTARFTTDRPADGDWAVPAVGARHPVPDDWRFLLVSPAADPGRSGDAEEASMRAVVERAAPDPADRIAGLVARRVLPAAAEGRAAAFGDAVAAVGRRNGAWYADEQGGLYRPPAGEIVDALDSAAAVHGAGQSSWGPTVYGVVDASRADDARAAGREALAAAGVDGNVQVVRGRNHGAAVTTGEAREPS